MSVTFRCNKCGAGATVPPGEPCGEVEYDDDGNPITEPCDGIYVMVEIPDAR